MIKQYIGYIIIIICVFGMIMVQKSDAKISPNIIQGMWIFEEGKGETVEDLSGNGSDGVFVGDIKWVEGKFGGGIEFTGVEAQNHVRIGTKGDPDSLAALNFKDSKGFSIHAWVLSSVPPNGKCVIWKGQGCSSWSQYLLGTGCT